MFTIDPPDAPTLPFFPHNLILFSGDAGAASGVDALVNLLDERFAAANSPLQCLVHFNANAPFEEAAAALGGQFDSVCDLNFRLMPFAGRADPNNDWPTYADVADTIRAAFQTRFGQHTETLLLWHDCQEWDSSHWVRLIFNITFPTQIHLLLARIADAGETAAVVNLAPSFTSNFPSPTLNINLAHLADPEARLSTLLTYLQQSQFSPPLSPSNPT